MNQYRRVWLSLGRSVAVLGALLGIISSPFASTAALLCTGALLGALLTYAALASADSSQPWGAMLRRVGINALSGGLVVLAVAGFTVVVPAWVGPLILVAVASSPWVINLVPQRMASRLPPAPAPDPAPTASEPGALPDIPVEAATFTPAVKALDDGGICRAWHDSYQWLEGAHAPALQAYVVALRQAYLDELDLRNPAGLEAWLNSHPRPRGGPDKYLHRGTGGPHISA